jgi:ArsR family transcriptional regulator, arsenate/arsenite/antimonite-responsive transcriptional repressor
MDLTQVFKLLSDESKYKIVKRLMKGEECVCTLAEELGLEQSLVSHHLNKLRQAGFIVDRKVGSWVHCSLDRKTFEQIEKAFQNELAPTNIIDNPCSEHDACCELQEAEKI